MENLEMFIRSHTLPLLGQNVVRVPFSIYSASGQIKLKDEDVIKVESNGNVVITQNSQVPKGTGFFQRLAATPRITIHVSTITMLKGPASTVML